MKILIASSSFLGLFLIGCAFFGVRDDCQMKKETYKQAEFQTMALKYLPRDSGSKSLIIIPPTGGTNVIDRAYAEKFCRQGYGVWILDSWTGSDEFSYGLDLHQRYYTRTQTAISELIRQIQSWKKEATIGVLGTSLGALHATVAASFQNDVRAVFEIVGGASIAEVVATSDQKAMQDLREARRKLYGIENPQQHIEALHKVFTLDPFSPQTTQGDGYKKKILGMAIAEEDTTVPVKTQKFLQEKWQPAKVILISGGHFAGIVKTWLFHEGEVIQFFEDSQPN